MAEEPVGVDIALAALAALQVILQVGIARGGLDQMGKRFRGQRRASQVGVQDDPRGIDDGLERKPRYGLRLP